MIEKHLKSQSANPTTRKNNYKLIDHILDNAYFQGKLLF